MGDYDSDRDDEDTFDAPRKRQKRFKFKNFAQRVAEVGLLSEGCRLFAKIQYTKRNLQAKMLF